MAAHARGLRRRAGSTTISAGHRIVDGLVGLQYDADCWTLGVGMQRYANGSEHSGQNQSSTRFLAQLTFKGLSNVDNGLMTAFRTQRGRATRRCRRRRRRIARFTNYE